MVEISVKDDIPIVEALLIKQNQGKDARNVWRRQSLGSRNRGRGGNGVL